MEMASTDAYGQRLTMTNIENLASLWYLPKSTSLYGDYELYTRDYTGDNAKSAVKSFYTSLFKTVAQANLIIKNAEANPDVFTNKSLYNVILGEAYAIRAYCQFDVLRIFGQVPTNATKQVSLPYSETTSIASMPAYYNYNDYVAKLKSDIDKAETMLKESDPAMDYAFNMINYTDEDRVTNENLIYRQMRLNYWAVRALHARMSLYIGETQAANIIANELINAKHGDGNQVRPLSGKNDYVKGYMTCPNECYFSLSKYDIKSVAASYFTTNTGDTQYRTGSNLVLSADMLAQLYAGENIEAHNRYNTLWNKELRDAYSKLWVGFKRYCFADDAQSQSLFYQIIPMLRTSEMYLIAIETSSNLAEINALYKDYMISHNVISMPNFESLNDVKTWIENEYRREFIGEGQMFYTYKRLGETQMLWSTTPADENTYIIPLPESEYDPNL